MKCFLIRLFFLSALLLPCPGWAAPGDRINPSDLKYEGAFLMPSGAGGVRIAHNPTGNGGNGSLFVADGRDGYGSTLAEITIPAPGSGGIGNLPRATLLQAPDSAINGILVPGGNGKSVGQIAYDATRDKIFVPSYDYYNVGNLDVHSLGWINTDSSGAAGIWHIHAGGHSMVNKVGGYAFLAPQSWADTHTGGRSLIVGFHRGFGNQSSNGPTMFAIAPWDIGNPPTDGADIPATTLLLYPSIDTPEGGTATDPITNFRPGYTMSDHANGAAWIEFGDQRAVLFVGEAGTDNAYCYGTGCPSTICSPRQGPNDPPYSPKMWWYDVDDFEGTAAGSLAVSGPVPYAETTPTEVFGGDCSADFYQSAAFDGSTGRLYLTEWHWTGVAIENVVHVYRLDLDAKRPAPPTGLTVE